MDLTKENLRRCLWRCELKKHTFTETADSITIDGTFTLSKSAIREEQKASPEAAARIKICSSLAGYPPEHITAFVMMSEAIEEDTPEAAEYKERRKAVTELAAELLREMQRAGTIFTLLRWGTSYNPTAERMLYNSAHPEFFIELYQKACALEDRTDDLGKVWIECEDAARVMGIRPDDYKIFIRHHTPENPNRIIRADIQTLQKK